MFVVFPQHEEIIESWVTDMVGRKRTRSEIVRLALERMGAQPDTGIWSNKK